MPPVTEKSPLLDCSDSVLSYLGNIAGILTLVYAIVAGIRFRVATNTYAYDEWQQIQWSMEFREALIEDYDRRFKERSAEQFKKLVGERVNVKQAQIRYKALEQHLKDTADGISKQKQVFETYLDGSRGPYTLSYRNSRKLGRGKQDARFAIARFDEGMVAVEHLREAYENSIDP